MTTRPDFTQQSSYKGYLGWNAYTEPAGSTARPAITIELFIKEHGIPIRQPKTTEIVTATQFDPTEERDVSLGGIIYGAPEVLQVNISGMLKTPTAAGTLKPVDASGISLGMDGMSYGDIITMFLEGTMNRTTGGAWQRKDPDYFISPYGNTYTSPVISVWETGFVTTSNRLQSFSATLILEK